MPDLEKTFDMTFTLTREEWALLNLALGVATGNAIDREMAWAFLRLANHLNRDNPNWTPYQVPPRKEDRG